MFCILGPEMVLGEPLQAPRKRQLFDGAGRKAKKIRWKLPERPGDVGHHTLGSVFSGLSYSSVKSSVTARAASVKITKRERKVPMRAQDIFTHSPNICVQNRASTPGNENESFYGSNPSGSPRTARGRSVTPMSALSLDKALPALPDERCDFGDADVSSHDLEGYIDMLAYLRRDLPTKPLPDQTAAPAPPQAIIIKPPVREEEWMVSSRSQSRQSTTYTASEDEVLHRMRSRSATGGGMLLHSASASRKTVTPMSSMGSDGDLRGATSSKTLLSPAPVAAAAARIEELSEPGTSSSELASPWRRSALVPLTCYHCGRDPSGKDVKDKDSPVHFLEVPESTTSRVDREDDYPDARQALSLGTGAEETNRRRHTQCTEASYYSALEEFHAADYGVLDEAEEEIHADALGHSSPFARPSNPDPYAATEASSPHGTPTKNGKQDRAQAEQLEVEIGMWMGSEDRPAPGHHTSAHPSPSPVAALQQASLCQRIQDPEPYYSSASSPSSSSRLARDYYCRPDRREQLPGCELELELPSFWKNPEGVIFVYQGVECNGDELYFGNDINYLGSFYDDDEGSSGLGSTKNSTADLVGAAGSGLAVIPEGPGSSESLWDDEVFGG